MTLSSPPPARACPTCHAVLPPGAPGGHCPRCLWQLTAAVEELDDPRAEPALILGDHELRGEIARGGMGIVYRAWQRRLEREVAVKVLRGGELASDEARARFRAEAAAAARLQHPGIVAIHDIGEQEGTLWFSMDYVAGENLADRVREHPLEAREAARLVQRVAEAVQHAHDLGVLHRDLKPSNILLGPDGAPRITDFGIARRISAELSSALTHTGQMLGSPGYAAPEQALHGTADARTDVYGLGALLYHLLTGRPPFQGPTVDSILLQLRESDPVSPRRLNPAVPRDLETICLQGLRKEPARRYATALALAEDLARFSAGRSVRARPLSPPERLLRWAARRPGVAALSALVVLLVVALVVGLAGVARRQAQLEHRATLLAEARRLRDEGRAGTRAAALATLREAWTIRPAAEIRTEAIAHLGLPEFQLEKTLRADHPSARPPEPGTSADGRLVPLWVAGSLIVVERESGREVARWSAPVEPVALQLDDSGQRLAAVSRQSPQAVTLHELPSGREARRLTHEHPVRALAWAGELLATGGQDRMVHVWDTWSGERRHRFSGHDAEVEAVLFRPDGQELISITQDNVIYLWHAARGVELLRLEPAAVHRGRAWWGSEGPRLFVARRDGGLVDVFRCEWPRAVRVLAPGAEQPRSENLRSLTLSADGDLAATVDENACHLWSLRRGRVLAVFPKENAEWMGAQLTNDGRSLWLSGWNRGLREIPIEPGTSAWPRPQPGKHTGFNSGPLLVAARDDGRAFALTNNGDKPALDYVEVFTPGDWQRRRVPQVDPLCAALSPDGRQVVTASFRGQNAQLWSLPSAKLVRTLAHPSTVFGAAFTIDGARLWLWGDRAVQCLDTATWTPVLAPDTQPLPGFVPSPAGDYAATLTRDLVILRRTSDAGEIVRLPVPTWAGRVGAATLTFSRDSSHLALHTAVGSLVVWNLPALRAELRALGMDW